MKNIKILLVAISAILFNACGDEFLTTELITEKTDDSYYTTPAEAEEALVGCYDALQLIWADGIALPVASIVMSDMSFAGVGASDDGKYPMMDEYDASVSPANRSMFEVNWANYYKGIFRVNTLLMKLDQVTWESEEQRISIEAEAHFLRAFFYFDMVRMWERIPLLTQPSKDNIPQSEPDETYTLITEDLLFAINNASDKAYGEIASSDYGHANKWAAESLLARVYLYYTGYYGKSDLVGMVSGAEALAFVEDVIANSGHGLVDDFASLWPAAATSAAVDSGYSMNKGVYAGETNKEVVFAIKYTYTSDYNGNTDGNHWIIMNGLRDTYWPERGYGSGWGACTVLPDVYTTWPAGDTRRNASIIAINEEGVTGFDSKKINSQKEYTGYFTKKYIPTCDSAGNSSVTGVGISHIIVSQFQDYFSIRYSDVLLMAAELGSTNALDYVNQVHTRAGLDALTAVDKDVIYEERRLEFAFEGLRYWDLLRYDNTLNYAAQKVTFSGTVLTAGVEVAKNIDGNNLIKTRGLFQIPENQITLSGGVLVQNPGWVE